MPLWTRPWNQCVGLLSNLFHVVLEKLWGQAELPAEVICVFKIPRISRQIDVYYKYSSTEQICLESFDCLCHPNISNKVSFCI